MARRLRERPDGATTPLIAVSGLLTMREDAELAAAPFTDFVAKLVEPSRLLALIERHASAIGETPAAPERGRRVLICDDEP